MIDPLTDEQIKKRAIGVENIDYKGLVVRHRVLEQTLFDMLFIKELIEQSQHEAAHLFMDAIAKSGASVRSANLDIEVFTPHRDVGNVIGERRMAFSSAYRKMMDVVGEDAARSAVKYFSDVYKYPSKHEDQVGIANELRGPLVALADHYGTSDIRDPRVMIRRMVGAVKK